MKEFILNLKKKVVIGIVGGSDFDKMQEQMGGDDSKQPRIIILANKNLISKSFASSKHSHQDVRLRVFREWPRSLQEWGINSNTSKQQLVQCHICTRFLYFQSIKDEMGEEKLQTFTNFCLRYMSEIKLPKKRCVNSFIYSA